MRWDSLFDDLESQLEQHLDAEDVDLLAEEERLRLGRLALRDRLRSMAPATLADEPLRLLLRDGTRIGIRVGGVGRDWMAGELCGDGSLTRSAVIPIAAIAGCFPTPKQNLASIDDRLDAGIGSLTGRLGLPFVLRDLCRRRTALHVRTRHDLVHGTIDRVGRDHLDFAEHEPGVPRRERAVNAVRLVLTDELVMLRF